jgi:SagB-type dehydrogenase family enzyme
MSGEFSKKVHKWTDFKFQIGTPPGDPQYWPKEWKEIYRKEYPRFPSFDLPKNILELGKLDDVFSVRHSKREYDLSANISLMELSTILYYMAGLKPDIGDGSGKLRRFYPSGGARYPLEVYLFIQRVDEIKTGIYHYNVRTHQLELLTEDKKQLAKLKEGLLYPWSRDAAVAFFVTAVWERNFMKYKDRGYRIVLMEAGHMCQNLALTAAALGMGCCNSVGFHNQRINEVLDIENEDEDSLYLALLGK